MAPPTPIKDQMAKVYVASSKAEVPATLNPIIVDICLESLKARDVFTIALSGGSLPSFLSSLPKVFASRDVDPQFAKWHVLLADERCVPETDGDSNLGALNKVLFSQIPDIPKSQIYGIDESLLGSGDGSTKAIAKAYEPVVTKVLDLSGGKLDLAVLGFGPDGHTCSLFPGHALLDEYSTLVASIEDSPKPPPKRITLTLKCLNERTRHAIFCGAGASKTPILDAVFSQTKASAENNEYYYSTKMVNNPAPYPCAMVSPLQSLTWVVDQDAMI